MPRGSCRRLPTFICALAALTAGATLGPPGARADAATVTIAGADATSTVDCRNQQPGVQRNRCDARADGGSVTLRDVDVFFSGPTAAVQVNGGSVDVVSVGGGSASASAICVNQDGHVVGGARVSICRARAQGGKVALRNVQVVVHHANGTTTTRRRDLFAAGSRPSRHVAVCTQNSARDCSAGAAGGSVFMRNVTMVDRANGTTRTSVNLSVHGGDASARVFCGNFATTPSVQINKCSAIANGGDATLQNVRLHVYER